MAIHMNLDHHEPPNGDFVRVIESMVGKPSEDPEITGKQITEQLILRAKQNREMVERVGQEMQDNLNSAESATRSWGAAPIGGAAPTASPNLTTLGSSGPPDLGDAIGSLMRFGARSIGSLLIFAGIIAFVVSVTDVVPGVEPALGIGLFFVGMFVKNAFS